MLYFFSNIHHVFHSALFNRKKHVGYWHFFAERRKSDTRRMGFKEKESRRENCRNKILESKSRVFSMETCIQLNLTKIQKNASQILFSLPKHEQP